MNNPQADSEKNVSQHPRRKSAIPKIFLAIILIVLLVPLSLQGLARFSSVADVRNQVDLLGGSVHTTVAAPEFIQSVVGKDWDGWERFYGGVEVSQIMLDQTPVADSDLDILQKTPGLRILGLRDTKITDSGIQRLSQVPLLLKLDLGGTGLTDASLDALRSFSGLQDLSIAGTAVSDAGVERLAALKNLTALDASGTKLTDASLKALSEIPNLKSLVLDRCSLTDAGLASLKDCKSLTFLSLEGIPLTGSFLQQLKNLPLEHLNLASTSCDGTLLKDLGAIKNLVLNGCPVEDVGIPTIATVTSLETLSLDSTKITDAAISELKHMPFLKSLSINSTTVSAQGLREFRETPSLRLVKAYNTKVTRGDVDALTAEIESFVVTIASSGAGGG